MSVAGNELILTGGRGSATKGFSGYYDDVHVLDLAEQEWKRPPGYQPGEASGAGAGWASLPSSLWNHAACAVESVPSYKLFCFGGQKAEFVYSNTVTILDTARKIWSSPVISGMPPGAREDCGVAYDPKSCNLLYFGGWRQGWLDDLCCLHVAGSTMAILTMAILTMAILTMTTSAASMWQVVLWLYLLWLYLLWLYLL